jgi:hypothetical protein
LFVIMHFSYTVNHRFVYILLSTKVFFVVKQVEICKFLVW